MFDLVVVGAGPSGAVAALTASRMGQSVLLLDSAAFPRDKVCAGCLSGKTLKALSDLNIPLPDALVKGEYRSLDIWGSTGRRAYGSSGHHRIAAMVGRAEFDQWLVRQAQTAGVVFRDKEPVTALWQDGSEVSLRTCRGTYRARWVIGADGVASGTARWAGIRSRWPRWQLGQTWSAVLPIGIPTSSAVLALYGLPTAWGWVFPHQTGISLGVGGSLLWQSQLKQCFFHLLQQVRPLLPTLIPDVRPISYPIPAGGFRRTVSRGHVMLVGDAAGLVDPFSGEGIHLALASGRQAAEAVGTWGTRQAADHYQRWVDSLFPELALSLRLVVAMGGRGALTQRLLCRSEWAADHLAAWMAGELSYRQFLDSAIQSGLLQSGRI